MALITFISDFGYKDHYVAAVKASMLSLNPGVQILDITHEIRQFDISHAAYVLRSVFRDFPKGTVHLVSVNSPAAESRLIAVKLEDHFFVGADNGIFSLISDQAPMAVVEIIKEGKPYAGIFPEKSVLPKAVVSLASGTPIYDLGRNLGSFVQFNNLQTRITKNSITGNVIHVDGYGNLITNISREIFERERKGRKYFVGVGRERIEQISDNYFSSDSGECVVLFNTAELLEIAIAEGNASELLGINNGYNIHIHFAGE